MFVIVLLDELQETFQLAKSAIPEQAVLAHKTSVNSDCRYMWFYGGKSSPARFYGTETSPAVHLGPSG